MPQLKNLRKGWTNEHTAKSILSKFCFITEPACIGDDVGVDFFCTYFKIVGNDLLPQNSFAIQIKSNDQDVVITKKSQYFNELEVPFFIGVVEKNKNLTIYSGESICHFFTFYGDPMDKNNKHYFNKQNKISIKLSDDIRNKLYEQTRKEFILYFPFVAKLSVTYDYEISPSKLNPFFDICKMVQRNISTKTVHSYIYELYGKKERVKFAGISSSKTFRKNFMDRFEEAVFNIEYLSKSQPSELRKGEIKTFEEIGKLLKKQYRINDNILKKLNSN